MIPVVKVILSLPPILKCIVSSVSAVIEVSASASKINSVPLISKVPFTSKVEPDNTSSLFAVNVKSSAQQF